jgi:hypothetical protein
MAAQWAEFASAHHQESRSSTQFPAFAEMLGLALGLIIALFIATKPELFAGLIR